MALMDVIRCDQADYLVWKWVPEKGDPRRQNAVRYGSSLRVKEGEIAVFVYPQKDGSLYDIVEGPFDKILESANLPVLSDIVGLAYGKDSPFQAEVYFINQAANIQMKWGVPYFNCCDPNFPMLAVPVAARGSSTFALKNYKNFMKLNRLRDFSIELLKDQVRSALCARVKAVVLDRLARKEFPLVQVESRILDITAACKDPIGEVFYDFGVELRRFDIEAIAIDESSEAFQQLKFASVDVHVENLAEMMRIQREGARLAVQGQNLAAHAINQQAKVGLEGASHLGEMGAGLAGGGFNPVGMMAGMAMGGTVGNQMAAAMGGAAFAVPAAGQAASAPALATCDKCGASFPTTSRFCPSCGDAYNPCPACKADNPEGAEACIRCGAPLKRRCDSCGSFVQPGAKFCGACGSPVAAAVKSSFCSACGKENPSGSKFCAGCGAKLS